MDIAWVSGRFFFFQGSRRENGQVFGIPVFCFSHLVVVKTRAPVQSEILEGSMTRSPEASPQKKLKKK